MADPEDFRSTLVLTEIRGEHSLMWRAVHLTYARRLVIEGHDLGDTEYEFERKLGVEETARVAELLGVSVTELLPAIQERFGSTRLLEEYLEQEGIPSDFWNRIGD